MAVGMAGASRASAASAAPAGSAMAAKYAGPHEMPTNVTLLSMRNADGSETLGVKLGDDAVHRRAPRAPLARHCSAR